MPQQILTIAHNTFVEAIRQPIFVVLLFVAAVALILNPFLAAYTLEHGQGDNKMMIDLGLSTVFLAGVLLAAFTATGVLSEEVENKTVLTVVSKPVSRPLFVLGKYLGVAGALAVAYYLMSLVFLLSVRHQVMQTASDNLDWPVLLFGVGGALGAVVLAGGGNYLYRWVFTSSFTYALLVGMTLAYLLVLVIDKRWQFQSPATEFVVQQGQLVQILIGLVMVLEAVLILAAVAVACSTRLGQVMTLLICVGVFVLGLVSNSFATLVSDKLSLPPQLSTGQSFAAIFSADASVGLKLLYLVCEALYLLLPNLQFLWPADALTQHHDFTLAHLATLTAYAGLYIGVVLCVAVALFQTREVG